MRVDRARYLKKHLVIEALYDKRTRALDPDAADAAAYRPKGACGSSDMIASAFAPRPASPLLLLLPEQDSHATNVKNAPHPSVLYLSLEVAYQSRGGRRGATNSGG